MPYRFNFHFKEAGKSDLPFPPQWYIYTTHGAKTEHGHAITPTDCVEQDIDRVVGDLIDQLNEIRRKLKLKYTANRKK